jgi:hypothetical protein
MDPLPLETKTTGQPETGDLQEQYESLRHLVVSLLILVIIVSGTLNIFFLRQVRDVRRELVRIRPQATQLMSSYQKTEAPKMQEIVNRFTDFGRMHPDYLTVLAKYGLKPAAATNASPPGTISPTPAVPPKK